MPRIHILDIRYSPQRRCIDYRAFLRLYGRSISISASADISGTHPTSSLLRKQAQQHAAALLRERSAAGYSLQTTA